MNTSTDVIGVEMAGALKNVVAIAAGMVEGLQLGNNAMAALVAQGCSEVRWLAEKMGAEPITLLGLSGVGDIMLTCFVSLSRNRTVGVRLGAGESLDDILKSSTQVAEGVATAGAVVLLARKYKVSLPVREPSAFASLQRPPVRFRSACGVPLRRFFIPTAPQAHLNCYDRDFRLVSLCFRCSPLSLEFSTGRRALGRRLRR